MWYAKARTAIIRNGHVIPAGKAFGIRESERQVMDARGFQVWEVKDPEPEATAAPEPDAKDTPTLKGTPPTTAGAGDASTLKGPESAPKMGGTAKVSTSGAKKEVK